MILGWWRRRKELQARIDAEARALIAEHGAEAYEFARSRALEFRLYKVVDPERSPEHWDRIRFAIRRIQSGNGADSATGYLEGP